MTVRIPLMLDISPLDAYMKIRSSVTNTVLLESMDPPSRHATQSVICFSPEHMVQIDDNCLFIDGEQVADGIQGVIEVLRNLLQGDTQPSDTFCGGLVGFTSYSIIHSFEEIRNSHPKEFPDGMYGLFLDGIVFEHVTGDIYYFHHDKSTNRFEYIRKILNRDVSALSHCQPSALGFSVTREDFVEAVKSLKRKIRDGEIFQAVLSQRGDFKIDGDRFGLYLQLRDINPSPYMYCIEFGEVAIIGSSPELLVSLKNGEVTTFPIAGTRPRGVNQEETEKYRRELLADPKELAEHNMLVDLARNDVGKVARVGSVELVQYLEIAEFSHVIHIVSEVRGEIAEGLDQFDAFFALFPAGTVSGAPKIRAMDLIDSFERTNRGPYAGAVGYFGLDGQMVQAIAIRTLFGRGRDFHLQAGAGIVYDSDPGSEYMETMNKLRALFQVMEAV